jgi:hypothetical protein
MKRAFQLGLAFALIFFGPVGYVAGRICWWSMQ